VDDLSRIQDNGRWHIDTAKRSHCFRATVRNVEEVGSWLEAKMANASDKFAIIVDLPRDRK
jgi:hypothetical protein